MKLAVVIGVYDERETIAELTRRLISVLDGMKDWRWELPQGPGAGHVPAMGGGR